MEQIFLICWELFVNERYNILKLFYEVIFSDDNLNTLSCAYDIVQHNTIISAVQTFYSGHRQYIPFRLHELTVFSHHQGKRIFTYFADYC